MPPSNANKHPDGFGVRKLWLLLTSASADEATAPTLTAGTAAPTASEANGSLYMRTSGLIYRRIGGAWETLAGAAGTLVADIISEATAAAGVTIDSLLIKDGKVDLNGVAGGLILDADGNTTIGASTDNQIDVTVSGAIDFQITANTLTAVSGSTIATNTIAETTAGTGVTIDGLRLKDAAVAPVAGGSAFIDLTACATGEADIVLADNLAIAAEFREAATPYLTFITTNDAERVKVQKPLVLGLQTIDMADAAHALVYGTAGAAQTKLVSNLLVVDPNSGGATEDLTLPPEATSTGVMLVILNSGGEGIVVKEDGGATVITLDTAQHGIVVCDGTSWRGFMGGIT